jgi:Putative transposase/Transposase zinc-binding domain
MKATHQVADVLNRYWDKRNLLELNTWQLRTLDAIRRCRTESLGGHIDKCNNCAHIKISYNSCRNRHCPKCQGEKKEAWIQKRSTELLPVPYYHVVFTLPDTINTLALHQPEVVYGALQKAAWQTIQTFAKDKKYLGAHQAGMISILHTWGQNLTLHPHLHCIVPGGGVDKNHHWINAKFKDKFLFPVKAMSVVFKAQYMAALREKIKIDPKLSKDLFSRKWVVYAKRPFGSVNSVIEYLGRYTHKIAISNHRIINIDEHNISFSYKDYKHGAVKKIMTLTHHEFIRRFALHILPKRHVRIRHFGILSSTWKRGNLKAVQKVMGVIAIEISSIKNNPIIVCPCCKKGTMELYLTFDGRGPPLHIISRTPKPNSSVVA